MEVLTILQYNIIYYFHYYFEREKFYIYIPFIQFSYNFLYFFIFLIYFSSLYFLSFPAVAPAVLFHIDFAIEDYNKNDYIFPTQLLLNGD